MEPYFDVCIFTNGRSSFDYCLKSLEEQTLKPNIHIIRDMTMIDGMNHIVESSKIKRHFLKVDDDFIFHSQAIDYIQNYKEWPERVSMRFWHLYDVAVEKKIESIKIYDKKACRRIGFSVNRSGRIDHNFLLRSRGKGFRCQKDMSVIALHACSPKKEQLEYERLWREQAPSKTHNKPHRGKMLSCSVSLDKQYENRDKWVADNNGVKHSFGQFIGKK
jgi:hypothetical protein